MSEIANKLYLDTNFTEVISELDGSLITKSLSCSDESIEFNSNFNKLLTVARVSYVELMGDENLEQFLIEQYEIGDVDKEMYRNQFYVWEMLIALDAQTNNSANLDEVLNIIFLGYESQCVTRLRNIIQSEHIKSTIDYQLETMDHSNWLETIRCATTSAVISLAKQKSYKDIRFTHNIIEQLVRMQEEYESNWVGQFEMTRAMKAAEAAAVYHIAFAVRKTADYLLDGFVEDSTDSSANFSSYISVIFNRADTYLQLSNDFDLKVWAKTVAGILINLHQNSIWYRADTSIPYIKSFVNELTAEDRKNNIFSLLPSQQDAIKRRILDPTQVAKILQMPTSGGKTLMAQLQILQTFELFKEQANIIYLVPTKALVNQTRIQLTQDFAKLDIDVIAVGSAFEEDPFEDEILKSNGVFIATYEKADMLLRTKSGWFKQLKLMIIDEAHNMAETDRGARLELLLANLINQCPDLKYLLLSPFMSGAEKVANWLARDPYKAMSVETEWRPSKLLMGLPECSPSDVESRKYDYHFRWEDPNDEFIIHERTPFIKNGLKGDFANLNKGEQVRVLYHYFKRLGNVLCVYPGSKDRCAQLAHEVACERPAIKKVSEDLEIAIAFAAHEYGPDNSLVKCLKHGTAFHHASLSPEMKFLIENAVKSDDVKFLAATSTIAQGINFPISTILMQSTFIPIRTGGRHFSNPEFWNIAGRAGRVGLSAKGFVVFTNKNQDDVARFDAYVEDAKGPLQSALLEVFSELEGNFSYESIKKLYEDKLVLRPFIQYLAHALVVYGPDHVLERIEIILQSSFAIKQTTDASTRRRIRDLSTAYLSMIKDQFGFVKTADSVGISNFSLSRLRREILNSTYLVAGPDEILKNGANAMAELIGSLSKLYEFDFRMGLVEGPYRFDLAGELVSKWINGATPVDMVNTYPADIPFSHDEKVFHAADYLYTKVSQMLSWGANSYAATFNLISDNEDSPDNFLPAFIQYGVSDVGSAIACQLGVPRSFAKGISEQFSSVYGTLNKSNANEMVNFIKNINQIDFDHVKESSGINGLNSNLVKKAYKKYMGL